VKVDWRCPLEEIEVGTGRKLKDGHDVAVLSIGPYGNDVARAVQGTKAAHYDMRFLKPLDERLLHEVGQGYKKIITVENGVRNGGLGTAVLEWMSDHGYTPQVVRMGLPDAFVEHGSVPELQKIVGMDADSIRKEIEK
jgi:1-deoxy-D-xylulose-5-phosphate synthase